MRMAKVRLGSARIDERGKAKGGQAGDQNGREVSTQDWYKHEKGWILLRPKSREEGKMIAWCMQAACDNPMIGYDQSERNTLYQAAKPYEFDVSKVRTPCETDCSSLVRVCCCYAGISVGAFSTSNEPSVLQKTGRFWKLTDSKYTTKSDYLRAGDVLVTKTSGHTVVVLNDGPLAGDGGEEEDSAPANPVQADGTIQAITQGNYWLRRGADKTAEKICVVAAGSVVRVYGRIGDWFGVKVVGTDYKGFISCRALPGLKLGGE